MTFFRRVFFWSTLGLWLLVFVYFSMTFHARWDFQLWLYPAEAVAFLLSRALARQIMSHFRTSATLRFTGVGAFTTSLLFPIGVVAFGLALDVCHGIRNFTGSPRPISAQYFFDEFSGQGLDRGVGALLPWLPEVCLAGAIAALALTPVYFMISLALHRRLENSSRRVFQHLADRQ